MYRPDIQGLRAVAVGLVLFFHLFPTRLTGGYVGVDVFFVISGYLITSHILREVEKTGTLSLSQFWARRIRRLLPIAFLVLLLTAGAAYLVLPMSLWPDTFRQLAGSGLYVGNWVMAYDAVGYLTADAVPTAVQHYWSLSVEEQFYIAWPLLLLAALFGYRRWRRNGDNVSAAFRAVLLMLIAASFTYAVYKTQTDAAWAFYDTGTRVWEFAVGAVFATFALPAWTKHWGGVVLGWLGLVAIGFAGYCFSAATLFPGWSALLPVLGAALVLLTGHNTSKAGIGTLLRWRPAVFIGDISYALYLWHWPLILLAPHALSRSLTLADKVLIFAATVLLAVLSTYLLENPLRHGKFFHVRWRAFAFAGLGAAALVSINIAVTQHIERIVLETGQEIVVSESSCTGPGALDAANNCDSPYGSGQYLVEPDIAAQPDFNLFYPDCQMSFDGTEPIMCALGAGAELGERDPQTPDPAAHIAVVGDSHAGHWFFGFDAAAQQNNWWVTGYAKTSCPPTFATRVLEGEQTTGRQQDCAGWQQNVLNDLAADEDISTVVVTAFSSAYEWAEPTHGPQLADPAVDGFAQFFAQIADQGKQVLVIKAIPRTGGLNIPQCLIDNPGAPQNCAQPRAEALPADPMVAAVAQLGRADVRLIDLDQQFCDTELCYPVVGDIVVYRDRSHMYSQYSRAIMPWVVPAIQRALTAAQQ